MNRARSVGGLVPARGNLPSSLNKPMTHHLPRLFLTRHGDTAWTDSAQRTGRTDIPLTQRGEERALQIGEKLQKYTFTCVFTSPLQRAARTCALAGFENLAKVDEDLLEWDYGRFEGKRTEDILSGRPGWELFRDGCPDGESPAEVADRADHFITRVRQCDGDVLAFSSGHIIRMIAARWLGLPPSAGRHFFCRPASVGVLGYEHKNCQEPIIGLWNHVSLPKCES
jgi:broad specificity phosphatase PhoE